MKRGQKSIHGRDARSEKNVRQRSKTSGKSTGKKSNRRLTAVFEKRVKAIEARLSNLEQRAEALESGDWFGVQTESVVKPKGKPGPPLRIRDEELFAYRSGLVDWLERIWPDLAPKLLSAETKEQVLAAFRPFVNPPELRRDYERRLLENADELLHFMRGDKFRRKPPRAAVVHALNGPWSDPARGKAANKLPARQVANAMAGVPELSWRTSLDRCSQQPSHIVVARKSEEHYRQLYNVPAPKRPQPNS